MKKSTAIMYDPTTRKIKDVEKFTFVGFLSSKIKKYYKKDLNFVEVEKLSKLPYKEILQEFREIFTTYKKGVFECQLGPRDVLVCLIDGATKKDFLSTVSQ